MNSVVIKNDDDMISKPEDFKAQSEALVSPFALSAEPMLSNSVHLSEIKGTSFLPLSFKHVL